MKASRNSFSQLASKNPQLLVRWIESGALAPTELTYAAEILGSSGGPETVATLLHLLEHADRAVREGAVLGLRYHPSAEISARLARVGETDSSPGVREAASSGDE